MTMIPDIELMAEPLEEIGQDHRRFIQDSMETGRKSGCAGDLDLEHADGVVVALRAGVPVGCCTGYLTADDDVFIQWIYVAPGARRQRLGRTMVNALIKGFPGSVRRVSALVLDGNVQSKRFHEALGFTPRAMLYDFHLPPEQERSDT